MAVNGSVTLTWGDGEHVFNIAKIGQALELEEKCGAGVAEIFYRLQRQQWRIEDARQTLRLGLIGGGMEPGKAFNLIKRYCDGRPWVESVQSALVVLMSAMVGVQGDEVGKKSEAERTAAETVPSSEKTVVSSAPQSMESAPPSGLHLDRSTT